MNSITFGIFVRSNWCIQAIIAKAFESGQDERGSICQAEKISRPDQGKGG